MHGSEQDRIGGSRREFLKTAAIAGGSAALVPAASAWAAPGELPMVTLGKTGQKVPALGMGTSWAVAPSFVQAALAAGIRYIDTSENYEGGRAERVLGEVIARMGKRREVYLVTKNGRRKIGGPGAFAAYEQRLNASLERLRTDYVDCYYLHGVAGKEIPLFSDPDVKAAFEKLKKSGKIRFCGLSCHDAQLPEIVTAAAECGWIDQIMIQYNYRTMNGDAIRRALDAAAKANLGLIAMKSQAGAESFASPENAPAPLRPMIEKGFNQPQAAIKTIFAEQRMQAVVSEMTNRDQLRENMAAASNPKLSSRDQRLLEEYRQATAHLYCHGCGQHCEPAAGGVAVSEILRYLRYDEVYGKRTRARELYQALSPEARDIARADLAAAQAACPHGLPVADLIRRADERMG
jgi:predicted aldo/keto reductase-like oxidoreductase